jgi:hypothetical protein
MEHINGKMKALLAGLAALVAVSGVAWSKPLAANLYVGTLKDVTGFDGRALPDGSYIEFRTMYKAGNVWMTYTPKSALVETRNPLKTTSKVGYGVIESARGRGLFAACVSGLETTNQYVARLFSGPTPEESVAYCDSTPFIYTADDTRSVSNVSFGIWKALDGSTLDDTDGDGLVDLAETTQADTDPGDWDTDGDGFSDGFEWSHGMNPREEYQLPIRLAVTPVDEQLLDEGESQVFLYDVAWSSISGLTYNLEYTDDMLLGDEDWVSITNVLATDTNMAVPVDDWFVDGPRGFFRVWTVLPETNPQTGAESGE